MISSCDCKRRDVIPGKRMHFWIFLDVYSFTKKVSQNYYPVIRIPIGLSHDLTLIFQHLYWGSAWSCAGYYSWDPAVLWSGERLFFMSCRLQLLKKKMSVLFAFIAATWHFWLLLSLWSSVAPESCSAKIQTSWMRHILYLCNLVCLLKVMPHICVCSIISCFSQTIPTVCQDNSEF